MVDGGWSDDVGPSSILYPPTSLSSLLKARRSPLHAASPSSISSIRRSCRLLRQRATPPRHRKQVSSRPKPIASHLGRGSLPGAHGRIISAPTIAPETAYAPR